jgi:predicted alpha-1,2-mannosidase
MRVNRRQFMKSGGAASLLGAAVPLFPKDADGAVRESADEPRPQSDAGTDLTRLVNVLHGTDSTMAFSRGNTLPIVALPFGMAHWTLQTSHETPWFFNPHDVRMEGIRCTHQFSPWVDDYGNATFLPFLGSPNPDPGARASSYRPAELHLSPQYMKVRLTRYRCTLELTPTERCAILRVTFDDSGAAGLFIDLSVLESEMTNSSGRTVEVLTRANKGGVPKNFATYYRVESDDVDVETKVSELHDRRVVALHFKAEAGVPLTFRIGTSFLSSEQASRNIRLELARRSFDEVRASSGETWESWLGRVRIQGATESQQRTFYSCLYRALLFPRMWHEPDETGKMIHFSPYNGTVSKGVMYADHGYWDDYKAWYPMMTLLYPERLGEILQAWVNAYHEGGWFPQFPCPGYRACMTGSLIDSVFGDAFAKGITGFDREAAYAGLKKHATQVGNPAAGYGRQGIEEYLKRGWVPSDVVGDGAVETLDSAYGDFCIAQVARSLGKTEDANMFEQRSKGWRALFDHDALFTRGKLSNGNWLEPFDPYSWGGTYVEGAAWQYRFSPPHDTEFLIEAMGGKEAFVKQVEGMLLQSPKFNVGSYGQEIHEMSEMAAVDFGQYAHSNQPVHHILYLLSVAGRRDRTKYWVHRVLGELYSPDIFPGDEDTGSMSAWYILGCLGIFSPCPGRSDWTLGSPLFPKASITFPDGRTIQIESRNSSATVGAVHGVTVNGKPLEGNLLPHDTFKRNAHLVFED